MTTAVKVELKYCECCGGLWLRTISETEVLCGSCRAAMNDLPSAWSARIKREQRETTRAIPHLWGTSVGHFPVFTTILEGGRA